MAEPDEFNFFVVEGAADHCHRVDVVEQEGVRAEFAHVAGETAHDGYCAKCTKNCADGVGVTDTLVNSVFERDVDVEFVCFDAADLEGGDDEVGVSEGVAAVGGDVGAGVFDVVGGEDAVEVAFYVACVAGGRRHEGEFDGFEFVNLHNVADEGLAEDDASGSDNGDFHDVPFL